jgi:hypothetical protein
VEAGSTYILERLSHDDCLTLFVKWAFKEEEDTISKSFRNWKRNCGKM